jgi:curved DNA-binding protein CbpA/ketosteroid isomerase-like protein
MKDYYKILGVEDEASAEEIRARWVELTKRYHPDLGDTDIEDEKIREINEAYEILKDDLTRFNYDFERDLKRSFIKKAHRQQERETSIRKIIMIPSGMVVLFLIVGFFLFRRAEVGAPPSTGAKTEALYRIDKISEKESALQTPPVKTDSKVQEESKAPKEVPKEALPPESDKVVSLSTRRSPSAVEGEPERREEPPRKILPESKVPAVKEVSKEIRKETSKLVAKEIPREVSKETPKRVAKEAPREVPKEIPKEVSKEVPREVPREVPKEIPKEIPKELPKEAPMEVLKEVPKEIPKEVAKEVPKEAPKEIPKEVAKEVPKELSKEVSKVTLHPGRKLTMWRKEENGVSSRPALLAREEEVKQFFSNYVDRYNRKDVGGFLSFFSPKAIQNQTQGLGAIRNLYAKFIDQSERLRYQIEGMKIEIHQHRVDVKARFRVDQKLKKDGGEKVWKGNIRWVLVKEEGRLKIVSLDYQNEKSP